VKRTVAVGVAVTFAVVVAAGALWLSRPSGERGAARAVPAPSPTGEVTPAASTSASPSTPGSPTSSPRPACDQAARAFDPRRITVPGVTSGAAVVAPPRDADGVPGVAPLTSSGRSVFAWDRAQRVRPGDPAGNVLLNAHTWPDGSALGNRLLAGLQRGDRIVVHGAAARLCYRVTERVEVLATRGMPRYYAADGPPRLAIVVCSGRRLGPGVWEKRTVWFASPSV
jgi:hypothetical protein